MAAEFERVYQGGHHDVYCNGEFHMTLMGAYFGHAQMDKVPDDMTVRFNRCDCAVYRPNVS